MNSINDKSQAPSPRVVGAVRIPSLSLSLYAVSLLIIFCIFKREKRHPKENTDGVPCARFKAQKAIEGTPIWIGSKPS